MRFHGFSCVLNFLFEMVSVSEESWDIQKHHKYSPLPWQTGRCRDSIASKELETIAKLLKRPSRYDI